MNINDIFPTEQVFTSSCSPQSMVSEFQCPIFDKIKLPTALWTLRLPPAALLQKNRRCVSQKVPFLEALVQSLYHLVSFADGVYIMDEGSTVLNSKVPLFLKFPSITQFTYTYIQFFTRALQYWTPWIVRKHILRILCSLFAKYWHGDQHCANFSYILFKIWTFMQKYPFPLQSVSTSLAIPLSPKALRFPRQLKYLPTSIRLPLKHEQWLLVIMPLVFL